MDIASCLDEKEGASSLRYKLSKLKYLFLLEAEFLDVRSENEKSIVLHSDSEMSKKILVRSNLCFAFEREDL